MSKRVKIYNSVQISDSMQSSMFKKEVKCCLDDFFRNNLPEDETIVLNKEYETCIEPIVIKLQWGICEIKFKSEV